MIKIASIGDWGLDAPGAVLAKISSRGLVSGDEQRLKKLAGEEFAHRVKVLELPSGMEPVYAAALASTESHGFNRNGDGYSQDMLIKCANTFETNARNYRHHKAKDPLKSYGIVKIAMYDPRMGIVHTLSGLFKDAETARKHGGGNPATEELEDLAKYGEYPVSQGVSVLGGDVCVICNKRSTKREDYCLPKTAGGECDLFGCRHGLSKIAEDGRHQALDNPRGIFHDLSKVTFPADRQAFAFPLAPGDMEKRASLSSETGHFGVSWLATLEGSSRAMRLSEGETLGEREMLKAAGILAAIESRVRQELNSSQFVASDLDHGLVDQDSGPLAKAAASDSLTKVASAAEASVQAGGRVTPLQFFTAAGLGEGEIASACMAAPLLFSDLASNPARQHKIASQAALQPIFTPLDSQSLLASRTLLLDPAAIRHNALQKFAEGYEVSVIRHPNSNLSKAAQVALDKYAVYSLRVLSKLLVTKPESAHLAIRQANLY